MRNRLFDAVVSCSCVLLYVYFSWHYYYGSRNLAVLAAVQAEAAGLKDELRGTMAAREQLEARVALLRPEHIDPDLLDEVARRMLDYAHPKELIIGRNAAASQD